MERDSLGEYAVPRAALWGVQTQRALENFAISGMRAPASLIAAYGWLKWAMARAHGELGLLPRRLAGAIAGAARAVAEHRHDDAFPLDVFQAGAGVSFHMNVNEVIANLAAESLGGRRGVYDLVHPNDHVNFGQSTNDTYPSALRMALRVELRQLGGSLAACRRALAAKAAEFADVLKAGRTHLQDAVPMRLGQEFAGYAAALAACGRELDHAADGLLELGLGGSAAGTGINVDARASRRAIRHLRAATGDPWRQAPDLCAAMQSQFPIAVASAALRNLALELIRIGNDLRLLASGPATGFHEIRLPALQPGSSIMPGKVNPVAPEMLAMVAFQVIGNDLAAALAVQAGQLELNVMLPAMALATLQSAGILARALEVFTTGCVRGIAANREVCARYAAATPSLATALNPYIGYARTARLVQESLRSGQTLLEVGLRQRIMPPARLRRILDPARVAGKLRPRAD